MEEAATGRAIWSAKGSTSEPVRLRRCFADSEAKVQLAPQLTCVVAEVCFLMPMTFARETAYFLATSETDSPASRR
jgi:hypothetical protein